MLCTYVAMRFRLSWKRPTRVLGTCSNTLKVFDNNGASLSASLPFRPSHRQADLIRENNRATTTVQQSLVHLFLTRFTLSDAELRALTSREVPVGTELFNAMDKTERIRADCRALLSGEAGEGTQAG